MHVGPNQANLLPRKPSATQYQTQWLGEARPLTQGALTQAVRAETYSQISQPLPPAWSPKGRGSTALGYTTSLLSPVLTV